MQGSWRDLLSHCSIHQLNDGYKRAAKGEGFIIIHHHIFSSNLSSNLFYIHTKKMKFSISFAIAAFYAAASVNAAPCGMPGSGSTSLGGATTIPDNVFHHGDNDHNAQINNAHTGSSANGPVSLDLSLGACYDPNHIITLLGCSQCS